MKGTTSVIYESPFFDDAEQFAEECSRWIVKHLGMEYPWPGNVRELEQCLRNLLIRGDYTPMTSQTSRELNQKVASANQFATSSLTAYSSASSFFLTCGLTADELMTQYIQALYGREKTLSGTARAAALDRRTVKKYLKLEEI